MSKGLKIAVIGGGSSYTPEIVLLGEMLEKNRRYLPAFFK
ncbi:MAG: hypothetical protein JWR03_621 [Cohnella sp.]|jgi:alpha-galactosidase/6-phospho-beta-glucosidase family protein|nr:hypothetical protein [Cohnella sp.]